MVLKLDYCAKILNNIHPGIDFIFIFDHSCGKYRGIECGFIVTNMNSGYGGAQWEMHLTNTNQEIGYLG